MLPAFYCIQYHVHCTVHILQCVLYSAYSTMSNVQCTLYSVNFTVHVVQCVLYSVHCTVCIVKNTQYIVHGTVHSVPWYSVYYTVHIVQCALYSVNCTVCIIQSTQYIVHLNNEQFLMCSARSLSNRLKLTKSNVRISPSSQQKTGACPAHYGQEGEGHLGRGLRGHNWGSGMCYPVTSELFVGFFFNIAKLATALSFTLLNYPAALSCI